ncbi:MAG: aromatic ring-hydroxylating dioxygenase subunit alpha [Rhodothermales bacterium]
MSNLLFSPDALQHEPLEQASTIPSAWYVDPRMHAIDQEMVLAASWQYVGHVSQLPEPHSFLTEDVAGHPVVVVRDGEGTLRAFYNVCKHRGGPLATTPCGTAKMLQCQYHGWTYRLNGSLRGVPRFDRSELFDKRDFGLTPVELAEWQGLLFVRLQPGPLPDMNTMLAGIAERIAPIRLGHLRFHTRVTYEVACNWKVYVDNYLEGYHLPLVHPELCKVLDYRAYRTETFRYHSLQHSPLREGDSPYGDEAEAAFYYFVFPNIMLNIMGDRLQMNAVVPIAPDRTLVHFDYLYAHPDGPGMAEQIASDMAFSDEVQAEDIEICEHVQRGLESPAYDRGRFSAECEAGVHHFQGLLKDVYATRPDAG